MRNNYFEHLKWISDCFGNATHQPEIRYVNTSLHGVGHSFVKEAFVTLKLPSFIPVQAQQHPDANFPTVKFPNPEETGALDLAIQCADANDARYILAQDPDADRFGAAQRLADQTWHIFTGDELGTIFAARVLKSYQRSGKPIERLAMVSSTVSSRILSQMAAEEGFKYQDCLTGFKHIGNTALELERTGNYEIHFGYEEAIGFMFGPLIRDKDGVAAAAVFAIVISQLEEEGMTIYSYLHDIYKRYGYHQTRNGYYVSPDPITTTNIFQRLRSYLAGQPRTYPRSIADMTITGIRDLTTGYDSTNPPDYRPHLPSSDGEMITFTARSAICSITLTLRASGTEPKIKFYIEGRGDNKAVISETLLRVVEQLGEDLVEKERNNLKQSS